MGTYLEAQSGGVMRVTIVCVCVPKAFGRRGFANSCGTTWVEIFVETAIGKYTSGRLAIRRSIQASTSQPKWLYGQVPFTHHGRGDLRPWDLGSCTSRQNFLQLVPGDWTYTRSMSAIGIGHSNPVLRY